MVNGKMYQTITLPAGHYIFSGTHFPEFIQNYCGPDMGFIVVAKGESIPDKNQLSTAIAYHDTFDDPSVEFTLDTETKLSVGSADRYTTCFRVYQSFFDQSGIGYS